MDPGAGCGCPCEQPSASDRPERSSTSPRKLNVPGSYLHSIDLYMYLEMTSLDSADWKILKVVYNS